MELVYHRAEEKEKGMKYSPNIFHLVDIHYSFHWDKFENISLHQYNSFHIDSRVRCIVTAEVSLLLEMMLEILLVKLLVIL